MRYMKSVACVFLVSACGFAACRQQQVVHPYRTDIVEAVYASGKIVADSEYQVYALGAGIIEKKLVKTGDTIRAGQVLYTIQNEAPASRLSAAESNLALANQNLAAGSDVLNDLRLAIESNQVRLSNDSLNYMRLNNLWKEGIGSRSTVDNALTAYELSRKQLESAREKYRSTLNSLSLSRQNAKSQAVVARTDLGNYYVRAKAAGMVYQTLKEEGEAVKPNDAMALLGKTSGRLIRLAIDQQDVSKVKPGQEILLKTDVSGDSIFKAVLLRVYPAMNEADQTFRAEAVFADPAAHQPYIHSSVEANIIIQRKANVLVAPIGVFGSGYDSLLVKENGQQKKIPVVTGIRTLNEVEIKSGASEQTAIIPIKQ